MPTNADALPERHKLAAKARNVHARDVVSRHGIETARRMASTKAERMGIEAAVAVRTDDPNDIAFSALAFTSLPHKGGVQVTEWRQARPEGTYVWHGGLFGGEPVGVPYGAKARMMLVHLLTEAIQGGSLSIRAGGSMYEWTRAVTHNAVGGMTYKAISAHSKRIAVARLSFIGKSGQAGAPVEPTGESVLLPSRDKSVHEQPRWQRSAPEFTILNEAFYRDTTAHLVPVRMSALKAISNNSAAIDLYVQLAWHLPRTRRTLLVTWDDIGRRFGPCYKHRKHMKQAFIDTLRLVLAIYPEARADLVAEGLVIHPAPPAMQLRRPAMVPALHNDAAA